MPISDPDAVLLIGAGVSAPFGVPQGGQMIPLIQRGLEASRTMIYGDRGRFSYELEQYIRRTFTAHEGFLEFVYYGAALSRHVSQTNHSLNADGINADLEGLRNLEALLTDQTSETIDDFIVENPSARELAKICIAATIFRSTYEVGERWIEQRNLAARTITSSRSEKISRNWIHLLINLIRHGIRRGQISSQNKVRIISFNYDGILEYVFEKQFSNTERAYDHYTNFVEIVHPHGQCGELNQAPLKHYSDLAKWSQGIAVVNEDDLTNETVLSARQTARRWIQNASKVYAAGFAFSGPNCDLLGMRNGYDGTNRKLEYCNYDGNRGVELSAQKCDRFHIQNMTAGTPDHPISVEDWILSGNLGELPG